MSAFRDAVAALNSRRRSYDDHQLEAVLRVCPQCGLSFYMPPGLFVCLTCEPQPPILLTQK